jgi:hypothetical protein
VVTRQGSGGRRGSTATTSPSSTAATNLMSAATHKTRPTRGEARLSCLSHPARRVARRLLRVSYCSVTHVRLETPLESVHAAR